MSKPVKLRMGFFVLVGMLCALPAAQASAQAASDTEPPSDPPQTVLVLSGGGARGMAHIGVLEVLEEMNVPFDVIIGTSMGAVVGGMYASGIPPDEMRQRLEEIDWASSFNDEPERKYLPFRRKEDDNIPLFKLEAGFNKEGLSLPSGLVAGQKFNFILRTMLLHTALTRSFDDLPVPFRAVATDLDSGEMVVIDHGDLPDAIRASMAFPVLFTPVKYKGRQLIDGGVVRNMAIDVALEMGAQTIIAVDVGSKMGELEDKKSTSAMQVLSRTRSIMSQAVRAEQLELIREEDVLITPDLDGKVTFSDFGEVEIAVTEGRAAAKAQEGRLRQLSVSPQEYEPFLQRQRAAVKPGGIPIAEVEVRGLNRVPQERILHRIETTPGTMLDLETLAEDLERVYLIGEFQTVEFALEPVGGKVRLVIVADEKSWGPWYVRAGLALEANFEGTGNFQANLLLRRAEVNKLGAEWKSVVTIGNRDGLQTELYQPLSQRGTWFVAPGIWGYRDNENESVLDDEVTVVDTKTRLATLDVGRALRQWGEIRLGVWAGRTDNEVVGEGQQESDLGAYRFRFAADRLDNAFFPREGTYGFLDSRFSRESLGADDEFERLNLLYIRAGSFGQASRNTLLGKIDLGTDFNSGLPFYDQFRLGGFLNLSGLKKDQLLGPKKGVAALVFYRQVNRETGFLGSNYYIGGSLETGNIWQEDEEVSLDSLRLAGSIFVGAETLFGPIYLGYGKADAQRGTFYLFLGRLF